MPRETDHSLTAVPDWDDSRTAQFRNDSRGDSRGLWRPWTWGHSDLRRHGVHV